MDALARRHTERVIRDFGIEGAFSALSRAPLGNDEPRAKGRAGVALSLHLFREIAICRRERRGLNKLQPKIVGSGPLGSAFFVFARPQTDELRRAEAAVGTRACGRRDWKGARAGNGA